MKNITVVLLSLAAIVFALTITISPVNITDTPKANNTRSTVEKYTKIK